MAKKFGIKDINVDDNELLAKGFSASEMVGKKITIEGIEILEGDNGEYVKAVITGEDKALVTGAKNIVARLKQANSDGMFPLECTVIKLGKQAFDLE